jgi:hypothetical protein
MATRPSSANTLIGRFPTSGQADHAETMTLMTLAHAVEPHHYLNAIHHLAAENLAAPNFLRVLRNAVVGFLALVFVIGGLIGFFLGRAFGRRG